MPFDDVEHESHNDKQMPCKKVGALTRRRKGWWLLQRQQQWHGLGPKGLRHEKRNDAGGFLLKNFDSSSYILERKAGDYVMRIFC